MHSEFYLLILVGLLLLGIPIEIAYENNNFKRNEKISYISNIVTVSEPEKIKSHLIPNKIQTEISDIISSKHYLQPLYSNIQNNNSTILSTNLFLNSLDKYSKYYPSEQSHFIKKRSSLTRRGPGFDLLIDNEKILVYPYDGSSAYNKGLHSAKYLHKLNDKIIKYSDFSTYKFLNNMKIDSSIKLEVLDDSANFTYSIPIREYTRKLITSVINDKYTLITIREYARSTPKKMRKILSSINKNNPIIIDLRYCTGGDLLSTIDTLSYFLKSKLTVSYLKKAENVSLMPLKTLKGRIVSKNKIYLLTSRYTASAAEVFIMALNKYYDKVLIIGDETAGKCLAQQNFILSDKSTINLSTYEILSPTADPCEGHPIIPEIKIMNIEIKKLKDIFPYL